MTANPRGMRRRHAGRRALLASTALSAALLAAPAGRAAPGPQTTPQGGRVVGGSASISQAPGHETITQTSQRAAIDWQSFNVGKDAHVTFHQPNSRAIALNRVIANDPSVIAGRIDANGQLILVNRSGVVFTRSAQVNAESLVVSTAGISPKNFMAGRMDFDRPARPGARIVNRGRITMKQAGLAAFVGPIVANHGTIIARLGHVELAGASAFILNASADGLVSINVTKAVRQVDLGGRRVTALVTNDGTIIANGGTVTLTARALDGLVKQLLDVRGAIQADSVGGRSGTITINGIGGNLRIAGSLLARGNGPGDRGGTIAVDSTGTVTVADHGRIDASGRAGGGVVAIGTDARRAAAGAADTTAPRATAVTIEKDAAIHADATRSGDGGKITLLSSARTDQAGTISARGAGSGDGGSAEISSDGVISLSGTENVGAPSGHAGTVSLDPATLIVGSGTPTAISASSGATTTIGDTTTSRTASYVDPGSLAAITGTIVLEAASLISIASSPTLSSSLAALTLDSLGDVSVSAPISFGGSLEIDANGLIDIAASLTAGTLGISLRDSGSNAGNIDIKAPISAPGTLALDGGGNAIEDPGATIDATVLSGSLVGTASLMGTNTIGALHGFTASSLDLADTSALAIGGTDSIGGAFSLTDSLALTGTGALDAGTLDIPGTIGTVGLTGRNHIQTLQAIDAADGIYLNNTGSLTAVGPLTAGTAPSTSSIFLATSGGIVLDGPVTTSDFLNLEAGGGAGSNGVTINSTVSAFNVAIVTSLLGSVTESDTGAIDAAYVGADVVGGASLGGVNSIDAVYAISVGGTFALNDTTNLAVLSRVKAGGIRILDPATLTLYGSLQVVPTGTVALAIGGLSLGGPSVGIRESRAMASGQILAPGGLVAIAPANDGGLAIGSGAPSGTLSLAGSDIGAAIGGGSTPAATVALGRAAVFGTTYTANNVAIAAPVSLGGSLDIDAGTSIDIGAPVAAAEVSVQDGGGLGETSDGAIDTTLLAGSVGTTASLTGSNSIDTLANFTTGGALSLDDTTALTIAGSDSMAGGFTFTDPVSLLGTGALDTPTLDNVGTIGGVSLGGIGNSVANIANIQATGPILLRDAGTLSILESIEASSVTLSADGISVPGTISTSGALSLTSTAGIDETGEIDAGRLTGSAVGNTGFTGSNSIATLGAFAGGGPFDLADNGTLAVAGPLAAQDATLAAAGLTIPGTIRAAGTIALGSSDGIAETGALQARTLVSLGTIGGAVTLTGANAIGTLGGFDDQGQIFTLTDGSGLTIGGPVVARAATISAWQTLVLDGSAGGGLFIDGQPLPNAALASPRAGTDTVLSIAGDAGLVQTGTFRINTGPMAVFSGVANRPVTVFLDLSPAATARFADLQAPSTDLVLTPGIGSVTGKVNLRYLLVRGTAAPQVTLFGTLGNLGGTAAAANGRVQPTPRINYTINGCAIGQAQCSLIAVLVSPPALVQPYPLKETARSAERLYPVANFDISPPRKRKLDRNVQLPNIATKDY